MRIRIWKLLTLALTVVKVPSSVSYADDGSNEHKVLRESAGSELFLGMHGFVGVKVKKIVAEPWLYCTSV